LRLSKLIQEPIDCVYEDGACQGNLSGRSFYFKINNKEVYMKGANMVPLDYYPSRMNSDKEIKWFLLSAQEANINILRIWGGGVYLNDNFYELAD